MTIDNYQQVNTNMKQQGLIWELRERGIGSEITIMLLGMLYCLEHNMEFKLSSKYSNLAFKQGWTDYFYPFCDECNFLLMKRKYDYNYFHPHRNGIKNRLHLKFYKSILNLFYPKSIKIFSEVWLEIWNKQFADKGFNIPELNIDGDCYHASQILLNAIWRIKPDTQQVINQQIADLGLDNVSYASLFIRRGDKIEEASYIQVGDYVDKIREVDPHISKIFVATDDYTCVEELTQLCPNWEIFSLCDSQKRGHYQQEFNQQIPVERKNEVIQLLTIITILRNSLFFVSTFSSNFARLVVLLKGIQSCYSLDVDIQIGMSYQYP